jgi:Ribbon-helix-helix protein, copG family
MSEQDEPAIEFDVAKPKSEVVSFRVPSDMLDRFEAEAERRGMNISEYVRWAAMKHLGEALVTMTVTTASPITDLNTEDMIVRAVRRAMHGIQP